jgi:L-asparaginase
MALLKAGLIWGGRLNPLKARVLLECGLRAGLSRGALVEVFDAFG